MNIQTIIRSSNIAKSLLIAKITKKRVPIKVAFQITTRCTMRCSYCYVNYETYRKLEDPSTREVFKIIDELYKQGTRWLWFLGGEPMMRKDFGEIIDYAHQKGMFCDMNSNGVMIHNTNIDIVKKLDSVCISLDGDAESNEYYRGKGNYEKVMETIKLLRKHKIPVRIHSILTKKTYPKLGTVAKVSKKLGATFNYCEVLKEKEDNDHSLTDSQSQQFYNKYIKLKQTGYPILHSLRAMNFIKNWPKKDSNIIYKNEADKFSPSTYVKCLSGDLTCFLDLDGKLYSCPRTWNDGLNTNKVGFKKAWNYLEKRKCLACKCIGSCQLDLFLGLDPKSIVHAVFSVISLRK